MKFIGETLYQETQFIFKNILIKHKRRARQKNINLYVKESGDVLVTSNLRVSQSSIQLFLKEKENWIVSKVKETKKKQSRLPKFLFQNGDVFYYLGQPIFWFDDFSENKSISFQMDGVHLICKRPIHLVNRENCLVTHQALRSYYKASAANQLRSRYLYWTDKMDAGESSLAINEVKSCWGSCNSKKTISLNWKLIVAPIDVIDYVIIHELAHLTYMNHSKVFWQKVDAYCRDRKSKANWLKNNREKFSFLDKIRPNLSDN
jgi:hypothetical protein